AYIGWMAITWLHWPLVPVILLVLAGSALLGLALERLAVRPFARAGSTILLLTTIAAGLIIDNAAQVIWGPQTQALPNP
ncbi:ABC transporter permease, partial [Xanthomonas citri pv. citri]|nr:ABC transporter permease [Xanthomonas citri pv. citri]